MNFLPFALFIVIIYCNTSACNTVTTTENVRAARRSSRIPTLRNNENRTEGKAMSRREVPYSRKNPLNVEEPIANERSDSSNRKTKFLNSLAFLANLANAASSNTKTFVKSPLVPLNSDVSRYSPPIATVYDPQVYMPHPYILATPLGLYHPLNLLRLPSIGGAQNDFQALTQNPQVLNLLDDKKPNDPLNNDDKYIDEVKRVENVKTSSGVEEEADESVGLQVEDARNAEEKTAFETACDTQKRYNKKQANLKVLENEDEAFRASYKKKKPHEDHLTQANSTMQANQTTTNSTQNSTTNNTETVTPPFFGYYGGNPQNVNQIEFTTETHNYDQVHYHLPSYDKPVNFYSDEKYHYYSQPTGDSFPNQFQPEQISEFLSSDLNRFLYSPDNTPPFVNSGFRPVA